MAADEKEIRIIISENTSLPARSNLLKNGKLYRRRDDASDIELNRESNTHFFYADRWDRFVEFEVDTSGKMTKAWFIRNVGKIEMKKQ